MRVTNARSWDECEMNTFVLARGERDTYAELTRPALERQQWTG